MKAIDFLPATYREARRRQAMRVRRLWLAAIVLCLLGLWLAADELRLRRTRRQLDYLVQQNATVQSGLEYIARLRTERATLLGRCRLVRDLQAPVSCVETLSRIAELLPRHVALSQLQLTSQPVAPAEPETHGGRDARKDSAARPAAVEPAPTATRICLEGLAPSQIDIAVLVGQLSGCRDFGNVRLEYAKAGQRASRQVHEFRITLDVLPQTPASQEYRGI